MTPLDGMKAALAATLQGIERYNPDNIPKLERYIDEQVSENGYDLEANLVSLRLNQQFGHSSIINNPKRIISIFKCSKYIIIYEELTIAQI
jgi:hypothetical protein